MKDNNGQPPALDNRVLPPPPKPASSGVTGRLGTWWNDSVHFERNGWIGLVVTLALCALAVVIFFIVDSG